ncbi:TraX family protein [Blautia massiliensis (ex Durand et al. 2017)]|uniref:TraX family protein n=1 Tax=Blautia massiliensis (ex Durand et al. 2017) TaxID=1737424 RepID=UPI0039942F6D
MEKNLWRKKRGIDSFTLHILAMLFMLCDHLWATLFPAQEWMTCVGRLAFPIFAFMIAEGCYYTSNVKKIHAASFFICHNFRNTI